MERKFTLKRQQLGHRVRVLNHSLTRSECLDIMRRECCAYDEFYILQNSNPEYTETGCRVEDFSKNINANQ